MAAVAQRRPVNAPNRRSAVGVFDFLAVTPGPVIVTLTGDVEQLPIETAEALSLVLQEIAPGRTALVLLERGATLAVLDDEQLASIGLQRIPEAPGG